VSSRPMRQFVDCLEQDLADSPRPATEEAVPSAAEPVDVVATAGVSVAERAAPLVALIAPAYWLPRRRRTRKKT